MYITRKKMVYEALLITLFCLLGFFKQTGLVHAIEYPFDIVVTFDDLQDWKGTGYGDIWNISDMPKKLDGSKSVLNYYSFWSTSQTSGNWIDDFGAGTHVGQTGKSAAIDLSNKNGPSRLGLYFGDGTPTSGYDDIYVFWRLKIPRNEWPTSIVQASPTPIGSYVEGNNYVWWSSWKLASFSHGFTSAAYWNYDTSAYSPYGKYAFVPHINLRGYDFSPSRPALYWEKVNYVTNDRLSSVWCTSNGTTPAIVDEWMAYEFHLKLNTTSNNGIVQIWMYDRDGKATELYYNSSLELMDLAVSPGHKYNKIFLGGNNSNAFTWGNGMLARYYVDDLIIHGQRIGPTYFSINGDGSGTESDTTAPRNPVGVSATFLNK